MKILYCILCMLFFFLFLSFYIQKKILFSLTCVFTLPPLSLFLFFFLFIVQILCKNLREKKIIIIIIICFFYILPLNHDIYSFLFNLPLIFCLIHEIKHNFFSLYIY
ncbi:hypothetical protein BDC45DRAFT_46599 [Circinella umbellata]|nr:hypothetical protein BDC45DRAFT_46599 [Circinella umbellata]